MGEGHLVEEDDAIVARALLEARPEQEALHLPRRHHLHAWVLLQHRPQQVPRLKQRQYTILSVLTSSALDMERFLSH